MRFIFHQSAYVLPSFREHIHSFYICTVVATVSLCSYYYNRCYRPFVHRSAHFRRANKLLTLRLLMAYIYIYDISSLRVNNLTLILLNVEKMVS